jgi:hypothetical protein
MENMNFETRQELMDALSKHSELLVELDLIELKIKELLGLLEYCDEEEE